MKKVFVLAAAVALTLSSCVSKQKYVELEEMQKATSGNIGRKLAVLFVEQKSNSELVIGDDGKSVIEQTTYIEKNIISLANK